MVGGSDPEVLVATKRFHWEDRRSRFKYLFGKVFPLEKLLSKVVVWHCNVVVRNPWPFIIIPLLFTCLCGFSIYKNFHIVRGVHILYSPIDAPSILEEDIFRKYWAADDDHFYPGKDVMLRKGLYFIVEPKNPNSNILDPELSRQFVNLLDWISNVTIETSGRKKYTYKDICLRFKNACFTNSHARFIGEIFSKQHETIMNITYPLYRTRFSSEPIDISKTLGGVSVTPSGTVKSAKAWLLIYQLRQQSPSLDHLSTDFQSKITQLIYSAQPAPNLTIHHYHSTSFDQELDEGNKRIAPKFTLTITILIVFSILCTFTVNWTYLKDQDGNKVKGWLVVDWRASKPILGICGVVYTLMAIVTAIGILLFFDVTFVDMCVVMPFLSLTIGIDDTFLLLASWHETNRTLPYQKRMEDAIKHAGVSIGITSLTDSLAFLIGSLAPLPAVIYFCYYSSVAILFIFIYSMTFFLACLSLQGKLEEEARHCLVPSITTESFRTKENDASSIFSILLTKGYSSKKVAPLNNMWYQKFFQNYYSKFITTGIVQFCGLIIYLAYIYITITGIQQIKIGFDITNIVQDDSPVKTFFEQKKKLFSDDDTMIDVAILRAPNLAVKGERELFFSFLNQIEGTFCSAGRNTTDFWFFGYKEYFKSLGFGGEDIWEKVINDANNFGKNLKPFFMSNDKYNYDVLFKKGTTEIVSFRLSTQLKVLKNDAEIIECTKTIRNICSKYKDSLVPFTYTLLWNLSDQFEVIWPQTMQDLYISICVMIIVSLLFIPQPFCALAIAATIGSIGFGVLGWMTWWDVNLDATSMITIAMSVGFSVDFAAHATYSFISCKREGKTPEEQLSDSLAQIGWPISQGSISVLLGISMLATVKTYVVETCFKTVFLVILFGMLHALFFLPIILLNLTKLFNLFSSHKHIISPA